MVNIYIIFLNFKVGILIIVCVFLNIEIDLGNSSLWFDCWLRD